VTPPTLPRRPTPPAPTKSHGPSSGGSLFEIIVVGCSAGGLSALGRLLAALPKSFSLPIAVVQHRSKDSADDTMVQVLQGATDLVVREAEDKEPLVGGHVFLAPPDYHLLVDVGCLALSVDEVVAFSRPSIDVLFETAADSYGAAVIGVLLTGANQDGTRGLERIKEAGGFVIVQDPATAESPTMPRSAVAAVRVDRVLSLERLAESLMELAALGAADRDMVYATKSPAVRV
jgi:two-component system chemotaxis response regulator CheB